MTQKRTPLLTGLVLAAIVAVGVGLLAIFVAANQHTDSSNSSSGPKTNATTETVRIPIQGMSCAVCAANVKRALQSIDGVQEAEISLERREARVRYGEGKVSPEQLVAAVNELGYKAGTPVPEAPR